MLQNKWVTLEEWLNEDFVFGRLLNRKDMVYGACILACISKTGKLKSVYAVPKTVRKKLFNRENMFTKDEAVSANRNLADFINDDRNVVFDVPEAIFEYNGITPESTGAADIWALWVNDFANSRIVHKEHIYGENAESLNLELISQIKEKYLSKYGALYSFAIDNSYIFDVLSEKDWSRVGSIFSVEQNRDRVYHKLYELFQTSPDDYMFCTKTAAIRHKEYTSHGADVPILMNPITWLLDFYHQKMYIKNPNSFGCMQLNLLMSYAACIYNAFSGDRMGDIANIIFWKFPASYHNKDIKQYMSLIFHICAFVFAENSLRQISTTTPIDRIGDARPRDYYTEEYSRYCKAQEQCSCTIAGSNVKMWPSISYEKLIHSYTGYDARDCFSMLFRLVLVDRTIPIMVDGNLYAAKLNEYSAISSIECL